jgi:hypothetical protein
MTECQTLAIDGGLQIEGVPEEKQPGVFVRRIYGGDRDATNEEVLDYYARELESLGGESVGLWEGAHALVVSSGQVFVDTFWFKSILTSRGKGSVTRGAPLGALTIDPPTGRYYSEMDWEERPDIRWICEFLMQHFDPWWGNEPYHEQEESQSRDYDRAQRAQAGAAFAVGKELAAHLRRKERLSSGGIASATAWNGRQPCGNWKRWE